MNLLKQSTAVTLMVGPFLDATDGVTAEVGLAGNGTELSKAGGAYAAGPTLGTHDSDGEYPISLTTTHTNTLGILKVKSHDSATHLPVWAEYMVVPANVYDSLVGGTDTLNAAVTEWNGVALGTTNPLPNVAAGAAGGLPTDTDANGAVRIVDGTGAREINTNSGAIVLVDTVTTNTDMRGTDNAALASVLGALADAAAAGDPTSADTVMQYMKQIVNTLEGTAGIPTFPSEAAPGNAVSLAEIIRAIHADVTGLNGDAMRGTDSANTTTPPTAAAVADAVWDEAKAGHVASGSFGEEVQSHALSSEVSGLNDPTAAAIADAVLDEALSAHTTAGSLGKAIADIETDATAIVADTNELQTDWVNGGRLDLILDTIATDTTTDIPALIAALNDLSAANVNAEVVDALNTDTYAEPGQGAPAATASLAAKIGYLYKAWRNKSDQSATTYQLYADDGSTVDQKSTHSDTAGTYTKGEIASGP